MIRQFVAIEEEILLLRKYAARAKLGIVEIGVMDGGETRELLKYSTVPVYGIDPLIPDSIDPSLIGREEHIRSISDPRFTFFKDYSFNAIEIFFHGVDLIFVDGSHIAKDVQTDFETWSTLLQVGGIIAFHDTNLLKLPGTDTDGPGAFIRDIMEKNDDFKLIDQAASIKVYERIK